MPLKEEQLPLPLALSDGCTCDTDPFICDECKKHLIPDEIGRAYSELIERETGWAA